MFTTKKYILYVVNFHLDSYNGANVLPDREEFYETMRKKLAYFIKYASFFRMKIKNKSKGKRDNRRIVFTTKKVLKWRFLKHNKRHVPENIRSQAYVKCKNTMKKSIFLDRTFHKENFTLQRKHYKRI